MYKTYGYNTDQVVTDDGFSNLWINYIRHYEYLVPKNQQNRIINRLPWELKFSYVQNNITTFNENFTIMDNNQI